jgi:hypothetical protein
MGDASAPAIVLFRVTVPAVALYPAVARRKGMPLNA